MNARTGRGLAATAAIVAAVLATACGGEATTSSNAPAGIGSVTVTPAETTLVVGQRATLDVVVRDTANVIVNRQPDWSTSNHAVATVAGATDATGAAIGVVTAIAPGIATVAATVDGVVGTTRVTVTTP